MYTKEGSFRFGTSERPPDSRILSLPAGSKRALENERSWMQCTGQNVFEMLRRGGAVVKSIHWAGFAAVGATWEPVEGVEPGSPSRAWSIGTRVAY